MPHPSPSNPKPAPCARHAGQRGLSLIELVMAMMVISVGVTGLLMIFSNTARHSADPMAQKQATAIAESLLNEVLAQPFTFCDPQDPVHDTATPPTSTAACTGGGDASQDKNGAATLGPMPASETRFSNTDPFDNVADYNGYTMNNGIFGLDDDTTPVNGLGAYSASVNVSRANGFGVPAGAALRVDVTVTGQGQTITLTGYRFRYAPHTTG